MKIMNKYRALLVIPLLLIAGIFFFFYHFGHSDDVALKNFFGAYRNFDKAISDYSASVLASNSGGASTTNTLERKADEAFTELDTKAYARISSLTKNDAEIMSTTIEIADLSRKELDVLKAYQRAVSEKNADLNSLAKEITDLSNKRQSDFARFLELAGIKN